jgi:hypothetical protein
VLGAPSSVGIDTGCGPRFAEVAWRDLVLEFRAGTFTGYRYLVGGWPLRTHGSPRPASSRIVGPRLATAVGVELGSSLGQARSAYGRLRPVGTDRWETPNGLVLRVAEGRSHPIVEIRRGTCGDF